MAQSSLDKQLKRAFERAAGEFQSIPIPKLAEMCRSRSADRRLLALMLMRRQMERRGPIRGYLPMAKRLIVDANNNCRWQALIVIGEFIRGTPEVVWPIVLRCGSSADDDMRTGVACVLLEDLLEHHRSKFERLVTRHIQDGNEMLADTLARCWYPRRRTRRRSG